MFFSWSLVYSWTFFVSIKPGEAQSKKGLGCEYTDESSPACRKKSNPIIENQDKSVSLIRKPMDGRGRLEVSIHFIPRMISELFFGN
jgi:hypothetical protein